MWQRRHAWLWRALVVLQVERGLQVAVGAVQQLPRLQLAGRRAQDAQQAAQRLAKVQPLGRAAARACSAAASLGSDTHSYSFCLYYDITHNRAYQSVM